MFNFVTGLVVGMILILIAERVRLAYKKRDDRASRIAAVVECYIATPEREKELIRFIRSGAVDLRDDAEVLEADDRIARRKPPAPIPAVVKQEVAREDLLAFLVWCVRIKKPPVALGDLINDRTARELVASFQRERQPQPDASTVRV